MSFVILQISSVENSSIESQCTEGWGRARFLSDTSLLRSSNNCRMVHRRAFPAECDPSSSQVRRSCSEIMTVDRYRSYGENGRSRIRLILQCLPRHIAIYYYTALLLGYPDWLYHSVPTYVFNLMYSICLFDQLNKINVRVPEHFNRNRQSLSANMSKKPYIFRINGHLMRNDRRSVKKSTEEWPR